MEHSIARSQSTPRRTDIERLCGRAVFVDDLRFESELHAVFLRSPHAHARIRRIDVSPAPTRPGVAGAFVAADLADLGALPFYTTVAAPDGSPVIAPSMWPLARDTVRYVGEPVAVVLAETVEAARDGAEAIEIEYEPLPALVSARDAAQPNAPLIAANGNIVARYMLGDTARVDEIFLRGAAHIARLRVRNNRVAPMPMEPRASIAVWDLNSDTYTLYGSFQASHLARDILARDVLKIAKERLRVIVPRIGGGFGVRVLCYREDAVLLAAAHRVGRPVRWRAERSELFFSDLHARDHYSEIAGAFDRDGRLLAMRTEVYANLGAYPSYFGIPIATTTGNRIIDGPYRVPTTALVVHCVLTNTMPTGPYRGAGRPEVVYRIERLMDRAAADLDLSAVEIRRRNLIAGTEMPYRNSAGQVYDSGDYTAVLNAALEISDWEGYSEREAKSRRAGRLRGRGICYHIDTTSGLQAHEVAEVKLTAEGRFAITSGTQEMGQSLAATYQVLAAAELNVSPDMIDIIQGDTARVPEGGGSYGSRSLYIGGSAVAKAAQSLRRLIEGKAAGLMDVSINDLRIDEYGVTAHGTNRWLAWSELAGTNNGHMSVSEAFSAPFVFPNGCYICEVEIDRESGVVSVVRFFAVDDVGAVINPIIVHGQVHGGVVQGLGQALLEHCVYDSDGQLLSGSFMDYTMPRAHDIPTIESVTMEQWPSPTNPLGAKGAGESGAVGAPPVIVSAIIDALRPLGVTHFDMPIRSEDIWRALRAREQSSTQRNNNPK